MTLTPQKLPENLSLNPHYMLGRFLGLAKMAREPEIWQVTPERITEILLEIADEHEKAVREQ